MVKPLQTGLRRVPLWNAVNNLTGLGGMMNRSWKGVMPEFVSRWLRWFVSNLPRSAPVSSLSHWNTGSFYSASVAQSRGGTFPLCDGVSGPVHWELSLSSVRLQPLRRELQVFDMCCCAPRANKPRARAGAVTHVGTALSIWARDTGKPGKSLQLHAQSETPLAWCSL